MPFEPLNRSRAVLLLAISTLCGGLWAGSVSADPVFGDMNCDQTTNVVDVQLSILVALSAPMSATVDADGDGVHDDCELQGWACGWGTTADPETGWCIPSGISCDIDTLYDPATGMCLIDPAALDTAWTDGYGEGYADAQSDFVPVTCGPDTFLNVNTLECDASQGPGTTAYDTGYNTGVDDGYANGYDDGFLDGANSFEMITCGEGTVLNPGGNECLVDASPGSPCYQDGYDAGLAAGAVCLNGGSLIADGDGFVCDCPPGFAGSTCALSDNGTQFQVIENVDITYAGLEYHLLKVQLTSSTSDAENWCAEYQNLCEFYGAKPTGCGSNFNGGSYADCKVTYDSVGVSNSLGCNASGGVANAAQQAGFGDANYQNSFAFHACGGSCQKEMCASGTCNSALSYVSMEVPHAYTLCKKIPGGCGIGTDVDVNNCGACGYTCPSVPNASVTCTDSECAILDCNQGYEDCDGVYENGCEVHAMNDPFNCGTCGNTCNGEACETGVCASATNSFHVMESQPVVYSGLEYTLLKVKLTSNMSVAENWCAEYQNLCAEYGGAPTGCGSNFNSGSYADCKVTYGSVGVSNSLGCNASGGVANAAQQAGYGDANSQNSFAFHACGGSCQKEMCASGSCNSALSYVSMEVPHAYTLCRVIPGGCGIGTDVDVNNCGTCGNVCPQVANGTVTCDNGVCAIGSCNSGFGDCDGVFENGCEVDLMNDSNHCGVCDMSCGGEACTAGTCASSTSSFTILDSQAIVYQDISYTLLKVMLNSSMSVADNWCFEYQNLCASVGGVPTGCGSNFNSGSYGDCKVTYGSDGVSNSLGCNASGGVSNAAQQAGYGDANTQNSFAFHACGGSCQKEMCASGTCNSALSYISMDVNHGYTLCKMP